MNLRVPPPVKPGATFAAITLSWGGAGAYPSRYEQGVRALEAMGFHVIPTPHALKSQEFIAANPQARLDDLLWALQNPDMVNQTYEIGGGEYFTLRQVLGAAACQLLVETAPVRAYVALGVEQHPAFRHVKVERAAPFARREQR